MQVEYGDIGSGAVASVPRFSRSTRAGPVVYSSIILVSEIFAGMDKLLERQADGCFEAEDAERALLELLHLLAAGMRSVVGGERVHGAVCDAFDSAASTSQQDRSGGFIL